MAQQTVAGFEGLIAYRWEVAAVLTQESPWFWVAGAAVLQQDPVLIVRREPAVS